MRTITRHTANEAGTRQLGRDIAMAISAGSKQNDLLLLDGELGAGKTTLARALIRQLAQDDTLEVQSPTYTLCQLYDVGMSLAHYDLYRLSGIDEFDELGWLEHLENGVAVMEWAERCFDDLPEGAVRVTIRHENNEGRTITVEGVGSFIDRIEKSLEISNFLCEAGLSTPMRKHLSADASARSYEIVRDENTEYFMMNSPAMPDGPVIRDGKPYSQIAHLAETVDAFVGVAKLLREAGFSAPEIPHFDLGRGLLLIEHLGSEGILDGKRNPVPERYLAAAEMLARLHEQEFSNQVEIKTGQTYKIPDYDEQAIMIEAELLIDWYAPAHAANGISAQYHNRFISIWKKLSERVSQHEQSLVLRDFHSPNILWLEQRKGIERIGIIDFQDALIGPSAYDVASLAQDARVDIPTSLEAQIVDHYVSQRKVRDGSFDETGFRESYAIMAAQRATKILGIFVRLNERDGKPEYLKHLPRICEYLKRSLKHPVLDAYRDWVETVIIL